MEKSVSTFLQCPASRFQKVDWLKDGNKKYIFSMKAYIMEALFRLRILSESALFASMLLVTNMYSSGRPTVIGEGHGK